MCRLSRRSRRGSDSGGFVASELELPRCRGYSAHWTGCPFLEKIIPLLRPSLEAIQTIHIQPKTVADSDIINFHWNNNSVDGIAEINGFTENTNETKIVCETCDVIVKNKTRWRPEVGGALALCLTQVCGSCGRVENTPLGLGKASRQAQEYLIGTTYGWSGSGSFATLHHLAMWNFSFYSPTKH